MNVTRSHTLSFFERAIPTEVAMPKLLAGAALLGAGLTAAGSIAPWFRVAPAPGLPARADTISGIFTNGTYTLVFSLVALVALVAALVRPDTEGAA
jgi:hypothetical protein